MTTRKLVSPVIIRPQSKGFEHLHLVKVDSDESFTCPNCILYQKACLDFHDADCSGGYFQKYRTGVERIAVTTNTRR